MLSKRLDIPRVRGRPGTWQSRGSSPPPTSCSAGGRRAAGAQRLAGDRPEADRPLRRRHRRPPVDPRGPGAGGERPLRHDHRARLSDAVAAAAASSRRCCAVEGMKMGINYGDQQGPFPRPRAGRLAAARHRRARRASRRRAAASRSPPSSPSSARAATSRCAWRSRCPATTSERGDAGTRPHHAQDEVGVERADLVGRPAAR